MVAKFGLPTVVTIWKKVHLRFCKIILSLRKSMPSCMVYYGLGRKRLEIIVKTRALSFWARLVTTTETKLLYKLLYNMHVSGFYHNSCIEFLENTMNECGYLGIWSNQTLNVSLNVFKNMIKTRLNDQYCQLWRSDVLESNKCLNYRVFKHTLSLET